MRRTPLIVLCLILAAGLAVAIPQHVRRHTIQRRKKYQVAQLREMLSVGGEACRHVRVGHGTQPWVSLEGYVKTPEQAEHLRLEMVRRLGGDQVGHTAFFRVQVVPPGTRIMGSGEDFWTSIER